MYETLRQIKLDALSAIYLHGKSQPTACQKSLQEITPPNEQRE